MSGGEALQHPRIFDWCAEGRRRGMFVQIISNGMSYSYDKIVDRLLAEHPYTNLQISLDATNERDYVAAKGLKKAPFAKILDNVRRVATQYRSNPDVKVVSSYVINAANIGNAEAMIAQSESLNVDVVHFHTLQLASDENWERLGDSLFVFPPEYHAIMKRKDYPFVIQLQPPLEQKYLQNFCTSLSEHLVVGPEGTLSPCCHRSWGAQHGLFQESAYPYNNPPMREMRKQFIAASKQNDTNLLHENCRMCNQRLKGLFRFDPEAKVWNFQDSVYA
jgi:MoaA/NifB/PqqE/SkfB family radical SAM enzyme